MVQSKRQACAAHGDGGDAQAGGAPLRERENEGPTQCVNLAPCVLGTGSFAAVRAIATWQWKWCTAGLKWVRQAFGPTVYPPSCLRTYLRKVLLGLPTLLMTDSCAGCAVPVLTPPFSLPVHATPSPLQRVIASAQLLGASTQRDGSLQAWYCNAVRSKAPGGRPKVQYKLRKTPRWGVCASAAAVSRLGVKP